MEGDDIESIKQVEPEAAFFDGLLRRRRATAGRDQAPREISCRSDILF